MHESTSADCRALVLEEWISHQPTRPIVTSRVRPTNSCSSLLRSAPFTHVTQLPVGISPLNISPVIGPSSVYHHFPLRRHSKTTSLYKPSTLWKSLSPYLALYYFRDKTSPLHCREPTFRTGPTRKFEFFSPVYFVISNCGPGRTFKMFTQFFFAAIALLLPYLYCRIRFKRLHQFARFPQLPPSAILGHLQNVDEFVKRSAPGAHPGDYLFPIIKPLWQ